MSAEILGSGHPFDYTAFNVGSTPGCSYGDACDYLRTAVNVEIPVMHEALQLAALCPAVPADLRRGLVEIASRGGDKLPPRPRTFDD